ncbi:P-II family nitrogen regulator [Ilyobacter polytropus]|uniref:Nitrogen regulatory protein P-II n=1 Tax=Ilyobacter polytropus (strain ATCC 51220 / DSM 2926 / LMG 16218 / CuHBu1) TaxID=572544 RepID=E3HAK1_ILYPC|nr:P-II family nitrogen regulator [Ilyobacter polytropus]ADO83188.1 nitrogen regulatory protein P-II [Ilyobacter polytropus DSM 2926]
MKEVMAVIRRNMINQTKQALLLAGIDSMTARTVKGRGKKKVAFELLKDVETEGDVTPAIADAVAESHRLINKRLLTIIVPEDKVKTVVDTIITVNKTGNPGDGKIFVLPVAESYKVRTGESGEEIL